MGTVAIARNRMGPFELGEGDLGKINEQCILIFSYAQVSCIQVGRSMLEM
jgi:hypothetical protein